MYRVIPKAILFGLLGKKFPLEGGGQSTRNFIFADDFCNAINQIILRGKIGKTYHFSGNRFIKIKEVVKLICDIKKVKFQNFITVTKDRMRKDNTYKLNCLWSKKNLSWKEKFSIKKGLIKTIRFYDKFFDKLSKESMEYKFNY